ncbi:MAG: YceI family protein [Solirubrobacteraceae bacterium]
MPTTAHTYTLGPDDAQLTVRTGRSGAAAKAGHNLLIEVSSWEATLALGDDATETALTVSVDSSSLRVLDGTGGMQALGDDDKANIEQTIVDEVLKGSAIEFRSSHVQMENGVCHIQGELELADKRAPLAFDLTLGDDRHLAGTVTVKQSDWGMKPYSALFGTLKVNDEVAVQIDGQLPAA